MPGIAEQRKHSCIKNSILTQSRDIGMIQTFILTALDGQLDKTVR
jgi:hypothetical protein